MSALDRTLQEHIVALARLAPSAHNTQPARWRFEADGSIVILGDTARRLPCADPHDRDFILACGAALEGTVLALAERGIGVDTIEQCTLDTGASLRPLVRLVPGGDAAPGLPQKQVTSRHTWRTGFGAASYEETQALLAWAAATDDVHLVTSPRHITWLAELNDHVTLSSLRHAEWRHELREWMRLSHHHPRYALDGMNLEALGMGTMEGHGARWLLGSAYPLFDRLRLAAPLVGEKARSVGANAIVLLLRPAEESPLHSGRELYRRWLELTSLGFAAWPMSAAVDDPAGAAEIAARFALPEGRSPLAALRVGKARGPMPLRARLPVADLITASDTR